jgi:penicillin-binding protein 1A
MLRFALFVAGFLFVAALAAAGGAFYIFYHYGRGLPDYTELADYNPPMVTRVHAGDGRLLAEYAREKRIFVPISAMPKRVIKAFLAAEDAHFYSHSGIDFAGVIRAAFTNAFHQMRGDDRRPVGASTITQQVAKNFLLTNEVSFTRKIKEAILAFRIERTFSKDRILELYLNEIYLGQGSYGVAAAAVNYFNKSMDELTVAEAAYLAGLPKAPNNYSPQRHPEAARARRDYVIHRMQEEGFISDAEADKALATPLVVRSRSETQVVTADFFAEEVRRELVARFGEDKLYGGGLSVRTTLDPALQAIARKALRDGLEAYDRRHGYRGPLGKIPLDANWRVRLGQLEHPAALGNWHVAVVTKVSREAAEIALADGSEGSIAFEDLVWARKELPEARVGAAPKSPADVLSAGDVIAVAPKGGKAAPGAYKLEQIPEVDGALVALDPHTGRVLAMVGGFDYARSEFNRATQAWRQPGSAFKPFVFLTALENGFTPTRIVMDGPFVADQGPGLPKWRPQNYHGNMLGPVPMRIGLEQSRNLMTVRIAQATGMDKIAKVAHDFGIIDDLPQVLSMSLGAGETTVLRLSAAYGMLVNGGLKITPTLIDRVQDREGRTIFRHDNRPCKGCRATAWDDQPVPEIPDTRERVADAGSAYQVVSMLQGVVQRGTGKSISSLNMVLAGKTGTTNDSEDTWFMGFSPDLVCGVFVGFDNPRTLGARETGSSVAVPIFKEFMGEALKGKPQTPFRIPPGIRLVRVDAKTGQLANRYSSEIILEAFKPGTEPGADRPANPDVLDGSAPMASAPPAPGMPGAPVPVTPASATVRGLY